MAQRLEEQTFKTVVENTPLVSIDLIIRNSNGQILLGKRKNRPAKGLWFVPGGRIRKNESFCSAFLRLTKTELGSYIELSQSNFLGYYEHFYDDNFSSVDFSTHYVVLAFEAQLTLDLTTIPQEQHLKYQWWNEREVLESEFVHSNTKAYFTK